MKRFIAALMLIVAGMVMVSLAEAGNCYTDTMVNRWLAEKQRAEQATVSRWVQGAAPEEFVSAVAEIVANELYIFSQCRDQPDYVQRHVYVTSGGAAPRVETVPAVILEHLLGEALLSPWRQFPADKDRKDR